MGPPRPLNNQGRFQDAQSFLINNYFRSAVVQGPNVRDCDDLKASETNRPCRVNAPPFRPPSWEHVAQISSDLTVAKRDLSFGKAGESGAYKKLPLKQPDAFLAAITLMGARRKLVRFHSPLTAFRLNSGCIPLQLFRSLISLPFHQTLRGPPYRVF